MITVVCKMPFEACMFYNRMIGYSKWLFLAPIAMWLMTKLFTTYISKRLDMMYGDIDE